MPGDTDPKTFWASYRSEKQPLVGTTVADPFLGGGTTLVEAARLGATVQGTDVDPLAVLISEHQLRPPRSEEVLAAGARLEAHLKATIGGMWAGVRDDDGREWTPLHYFTIASVTCPGCDTQAPLYRSLVIARSVGKAGAVVRDTEMTAFCPDCFGLQHLSADRKTITCCGRRRSLDEGTFVRTRFACPSCDTRSSHEQLQTGAASRILIAVEDTPAVPTRASSRRRIRAPRPSDKAAVTRADKWAVPARFAAQVSMPLVAGERDRRPLSFGIRRVEDLHTSRQVAYLTEALAWIQGAGLPTEVERALSLALSTTITCNNRLCGYATDYGRLSPLFSVRAFALPSLTVELNPLNPNGGRGTLSAALTRVAQSCDDNVRRHLYPTTPRASSKPVAQVLNLPRVREGHALVCADSAADGPQHAEGSAGQGAAPVLADLCITDPPYFDFIPYDALSQVFRVWLTGRSELSGAPLLPGNEDPVSGFGTALGAALRTALAGCKPDALVAFTYKGGADAWEAVGVALDEAKLRVTALWPVLADPHMGHHTHEGNCEYDVLVVARPVTAVQAIPQSDIDIQAVVATHITALRKTRRVSAADEKNLTVAMTMGSTRFATMSR